MLTQSLVLGPAFPAYTGCAPVALSPSSPPRSRRSKRPSHATGKRGAVDGDLIKAIENELRQIAAARLRYEKGCSLSTGDLINEALARIISQDGLDLANRSEALALSSYVMRQVLVDHARRKQADKRSHQPVTLHSQIPGTEPVDLLDLEAQLAQLAEIDQSRVRLVEMRFYGGMTLEEVAEATGTSLATVKRRWASTRAWLQDRLERE